MAILDSGSGTSHEICPGVTFSPGVTTDLAHSKPSSYTNFSAGRGSASYPTGPPHHRTTRFKTVASLSSFSPGPILPPTLSPYFLRISSSIHFNESAGPTNAKSSPCTAHTVLHGWCLKMHGLDWPCLKPSAISVQLYRSCHQSSALSVPYMCCLSSPAVVPWSGCPYGNSTYVGLSGPGFAQK